MTELVKCSLHVSHSLLNTQERATLVNFTVVIDPKKYSSLTRLLRISAYVLRLINMMKSTLQAQAANL